MAQTILTAVLEVEPASEALLRERILDLRSPKSRAGRHRWVIFASFPTYCGSVRWPPSRAGPGHREIGIARTVSRTSVAADSCCNG